MSKILICVMVILSVSNASNKKEKYGERCLNNVTYIKYEDLNKVALTPKIKLDKFGKMSGEYCQKNNIKTYKEGKK